MDNPTQSELSNPTSPPSTTPNLAQPLCNSKFNGKIHFEDSNLENGSLNNVYLIFFIDMYSNGKKYFEELFFILFQI